MEEKKKRKHLFVGGITDSELLDFLENISIKEITEKTNINKNIADPKEKGDNEVYVDNLRKQCDGINNLKKHAGNPGFEELFKQEIEKLDMMIL